MVNTLEIKGARTRLGLNQTYMAKKLGITTQSYCRKERNRIPFTEKQKFQVAEILDLSLEQMNDYLFDKKLPKGTIA